MADGLTTNNVEVTMTVNSYRCCRLASKEPSIAPWWPWPTERAPPEICCCHSGSGQPICYEDDRDGDAIGCLVVGLEIGWLGSWVPCEPGRHLAAWPRGRREHYGNSWWSWRWTGDQWSRRSRHCRQTGAIWLAAAVFGTTIVIDVPLIVKRWGRIVFWVALSE